MFFKVMHQLRILAWGFVGVGFWNVRVGLSIFNAKQFALALRIISICTVLRGAFIFELKFGLS